MKGKVEQQGLKLEMIRNKILVRYKLSHVLLNVHIILNANTLEPA